jgi:hypothetical protein
MVFSRVNMIFIRVEMVFRRVNMVFRPVDTIIQTSLEIHDLTLASENPAIDK